MKIIWCFFSLAFLVLNSAAQQDPLYNMYQFNQVLINPAYTGARDAATLAALRRQQWVGMNGSPETNCLSIHTPVMDKKLGVGLTAINDKLGPRNVIGVYGTVAYILRLNERMKLSFGINAGYNRFQFDYSSIELKNGQLPADLYGIQNKSTLDINGGLYLRSKSFFAGISATHLNGADAYAYQAVAGQDKFVYKLNSHLFFTAGKSFAVSNHLVFAPTTMIRFVNGNTGVDLNANFLLHRRLWLGTFYRTSSGAGGLVQFYINNKIRAGVSYDSGLGESIKLGPSFEAMIGIDLANLKTKSVDIRFL